MSVLRGVERSGTDTLTSTPEKNHKDLLALRAIVHPDGDDAKLTLHTDQGSLSLTISHDRFPGILAEIESAAIVIEYRQSMKRDEGAAAFDEVFRTALRPVETSVVIDKPSGDRLFVHQFKDRMLVVIRMTAEQVGDMLSEHSSLSRRAAN